jgi:hypothetical protein
MGMSMRIIGDSNDFFLRSLVKRQGPRTLVPSKGRLAYAHLTLNSAKTFLSSTFDHLPQRESQLVRSLLSYRSRQERTRGPINAKKHMTNSTPSRSLSSSTHNPSDSTRLLIRPLRQQPTREFHSAAFVKLGFPGPATLLRWLKLFAKSQARFGPKVKPWLLVLQHHTHGHWQKDIIRRC